MIEARCRYRAPARYDDQILIETRPSLLRGVGHQVCLPHPAQSRREGEEPTLLAEGETVHVVCDDQLNKKPLPERHAEALRALMADE